MYSSQILEDERQGLAPRGVYAKIIIYSSPLFVGWHGFLSNYGGQGCKKIGTNGT